MKLFLLKGEELGREVCFFKYLIFLFFFKFEYIKRDRVENRGVFWAGEEEKNEFILNGLVFHPSFGNVFFIWFDNYVEFF